MAEDDLLAPAAGDVIVVTQKVVSKAEGRIVDLATIEPRAEAVEWARRWGKDPRQIEVVLRDQLSQETLRAGALLALDPADLRLEELLDLDRQPHRPPEKHPLAGHIHAGEIVSRNRSRAEAVWFVTPQSVRRVCPR